MQYWQNWQNSFRWMFKVASVTVRKRKNLVLVKKRTLFLQKVSVDTCLAIFSKLAKRCRKTFKQDMLQIPIWEKTNIFKKAVFSRNHAPLDNWNAVLNILPKRFYQIFGRNSCINREKTWFFEKKCLFFKKLPLKTSEIVWKIRPKLFTRSPKKILYLNFCSNKIVFPQKFQLADNVKFWQLCWSFLINLRSNSLKIRSYCVRSIFSISLFFTNCSSGHIKMHFCQICCKI